MKKNIVREFVSLRNALQQEKQILEARLRELNEALGAGAGAESPKVATARAAGRRRGPRRMSAEARAKIAEAQKARWARIKGGASGQSPTAAPKKARKRKMSPEGRARIAEAAKRRWAKFRAAK